MSFPKPYLVRLEYWNAQKSQWGPGHEELGLLDPATYVQKLAKRGVIARTTDWDTGEVIYADGGDLL